MRNDRCVDICILENGGGDFGTLALSLLFEYICSL